MTSRFNLKSILLGLAAVLLCGPSLCLAQLKVQNPGIATGRIAFTYILNGKSQIYVLDFSKNAVAPVITPDAVSEYPDWSPDGRTFVYYSNVSGDKEIYKANFDGSGIVQLTNSKGVDEDPDFSPDGKQIVFHSDRLGGGGTNLFVMDQDGANQTAVTTIPGNAKRTVPRWSPRGDEVVFSTDEHWPGWDIGILDLNSKKVTRLTHGLFSHCRAAWNPDGSLFVFSYGSGGEIDLWTMEKGKSEPTQITTRTGREYDAVWDDSGDRIFFVAESGPKQEDFQLFMLDLKKKKEFQLTTGMGAIRYPSFTSLPTPPSVLETPPAQPTEPISQQPSVEDHIKPPVSNSAPNTNSSGKPGEFPSAISKPVPVNPNEIEGAAVPGKADEKNNTNELVPWN